MIMTGVIVKPQRGVAPGYTLTCMTGSDRINACCIQNNKNNMFKKKNTCTCSTEVHGHAYACSSSCICEHLRAVHSMCSRLFVRLAARLRQNVFSAVLYDQCRSINNATLAEVKEACVSGGKRRRGRKKENEVVGNKENEAAGECWGQTAGRALM